MDEAAAPEQARPREIEAEMKESYLNYAMSVIVGRALPDARDGLKPVHRRILYAMNEMGMQHSKPYRKSARIVGEVLGKYHPHGDMAVYDALVRMTQEFSLRYPLIQGQGNFGSIDGDMPAAMRYTEARMQKLAEEMLASIDMETVDFSENFDGSLKEPTVLPSRFPNLLVNGSAGIAVGMATNIPPHNMREITDAAIALIDHPETGLMDLLKLVSGPDFPTGGTICGRNGIISAYSTGRGRVVVRANYHIEKVKERQKIVIDEIPYLVNKAEAIAQIAELVRDKKIQGISDLRDESDREGMRVVIELKQDANADVVMNQVYKHSRMQTTFGITLLALVDNRPRVLTLKEMLEQHLLHQKSVVTRRTQHELRKSEERMHILEGIIIALNDVDRAIRLIKGSSSVQDARDALRGAFSLSEIQANAILDLKLQKLASLEQEKIREEQRKLAARILELKEILSDEKRVFAIIRSELEEMKKSYGDDRRTLITEEEMSELDLADLIDEEDVAVTVTSRGYIKRQSLDAYRQQKRGGVGIVAANTKEEDFITDLFIANTHSSLLFFTDKGRVHWLKTYSLPDGSRQASGKAIVNLLHLDEGEGISTYIPVKDFGKEGFLTMVTRNGTIKKTDLSSYSNPRKGGIIAINLMEGDSLIDVLLTDGTKELVIATKNGMAARFREQDVRAVGRNSIGVRGIRLRKGDEVIGAVIADDRKTLLTLTENGYGKRTPFSEYRTIGRGGIGVISIITSERNGSVVRAMAVSEGEEMMAITRNGIAARMPVEGISVIGRNTQGVRVMKLREGDRLVSAAKIVKA